MFISLFGVEWAEDDDEDEERWEVISDSNFDLSDIEEEEGTGDCFAVDFWILSMFFWADCKMRKMPS